MGTNKPCFQFFYQAAGQRFYPQRRKTPKKQATFTIERNLHILSETKGYETTSISSIVAATP